MNSEQFRIARDPNDGQTRNGGLGSLGGPENDNSTGTLHNIRSQIEDRNMSIDNKENDNAIKRNGSQLSIIDQNHQEDDQAEELTQQKQLRIDNHRNKTAMDEICAEGKKQVEAPTRQKMIINAALSLEDSPMPLIKTGSSMMPDMKFGWKPEVKTSNPPIPLYFDFVQHRMHPYQFGRISRDPKGPLTDSFANKSLVNGASSYRFNFPKHHAGGKYNYDGLLEQIFGSRNPEQREDDDSDVGFSAECEEINNELPADQEYRFLPFDADFESGNLDLVIKCEKQNCYDVFLRPDTNTTGYFQWFYFRLRNRLKGTKVRINVVNMTKRNSLYLQGMPIQVFSVKRSIATGQTWVFGGENLKYGISKVSQRPTEDMPRPRIYYQVGWDYTFEHDDDQVFFAYSRPYTFSMVTNLVQKIQEQQDKLIAEFRSKAQNEEYDSRTITEDSFRLVQSSSLTTSLGGVDVPMLTITDFGHTRAEEQRKKVIIVTGRVHPVETHASWVIHGLIKFLLSKDKVADALRKRVVFKIIPMINVDGVVIGNTRCSFIGRDVNRLYSHPNMKLVPEPYYLRNLIRELQKTDKYKVQFYLDVHAHSGRKAIFMYGPYFPLHCSKYMKIRTLPKLISERTDMFRFFSCKFRIEKYKENCARIAFWRDFNITNMYTVETSSYGYLSRDRQTIAFDGKSFQEFGECLIHSIFEYLLIQDEDRRMKLALAKRLKAQRKTKRHTIAEILGGLKPYKVKRGTGTTNNHDLQQEQVYDHFETEAAARNNNANIVANPNEAECNNLNDHEPSQGIINLQFTPRMTALQRDQHNNSRLRNNSLQLRLSGAGEIAGRIVAGQQREEAQSRRAYDSDGSAVDSHAFINSDSSSEVANHTAILSSTPHSNNKINGSFINVYDNGVQRSKHSILQPKLQPAKLEKQSEIEEMLQRKKGFDVIDSDQLFQLLYNPSYSKWMAKKQQIHELAAKAQTKKSKKQITRLNSMIGDFYDRDDLKSEFGNELQKKTGKAATTVAAGDDQASTFTEAIDSYVSKQKTLEHPQKEKQGRSSTVGQPVVIRVADIKHAKKDSRISNSIQRDIDRSSQQQEDFFLKEVRTFEEVFKSIKDKAKGQQLRKDAILQNKDPRKKQIKSGVVELDFSDSDGYLEDESDDSNEHLENMYNFARDEQGHEINFLEKKDFSDDLLDDQDIDDQDREVLNDRILGIINVFQQINQNSNQSTTLSSKQIKLLQELGQKRMSIEKNNTAKREDSRATNQDQFLIGQKALGSKGQKDSEIIHNKRLAARNSQTKCSINLNQSCSNRELLSQMTNQRKENKQASLRHKKRNEEPLSCNPMMLHPPPSMIVKPRPQPVYNIYNLGEIPADLKSSISTSINSAAQMLYGKGVRGPTYNSQLRYPIKLQTNKVSSEETHARQVKGPPQNSLNQRGSKTIQGQIIKSRLDLSSNYKHERQFDNDFQPKNLFGDWIQASANELSSLKNARTSMENKYRLSFVAQDHDFDTTAPNKSHDSDHLKNNRVVYQDKQKQACTQMNANQSNERRQQHVNFSQNQIMRDDQNRKAIPKQAASSSGLPLRVSSEHIQKRQAYWTSKTSAINQDPKLDILKRKGSQLNEKVLEGDEEYAVLQGCMQTMIIQDIISPKNSSNDKNLKGFASSVQNGQQKRIRSAIKGKATTSSKLIDMQRRDNPSCMTIYEQAITNVSQQSPSHIDKPKPLNLQATQNLMVDDSQEQSELHENIKRAQIQQSTMQIEKRNQPNVRFAFQNSQARQQISDESQNEFREKQRIVQNQPIMGQIRSIANNSKEHHNNKYRFRNQQLKETTNKNSQQMLIAQEQASSQRSSDKVIPMKNSGLNFVCHNAPIKIEQLIQNTNNFSQSAVNFGQSNIKTYLARKRNNMQENNFINSKQITSKRDYLNHQKNKKLVTPFRLDDHADVSNIIVGAQGSLKSHINQLRPRSVSKTQKSRLQYQKNQNKNQGQLNQQQENNSLVQVRGLSKDILQSNVFKNAKQTLARQKNHKNLSPTHDELFDQININTYNERNDSKRKNSAIKQSIQQMSQTQSINNAYKDQLDKIKATQQSLWDQRVMLFEESQQRKQNYNTKPFKDKRSIDTTPEAKIQQSQAKVSRNNDKYFCQFL